MEIEKLLQAIENDNYKAIREWLDADENKNKKEA